MGLLEETITAKAKEAGGLRALARQLEMDVAYLSKLRTGKRPGSDEVLAKLGLQRVTYLVPLDTDPSP